MIFDHRHLICFSFRFPLTRYELITAVSFKNCASKNAMCEKLICNNDYSPACGNDAITYTNLCHLQKATCMTGIQLAHAGQCVKNPHKKEENCPKNCDKAENKIVCGSDGNAYRFTKNYFALHTVRNLHFCPKIQFWFSKKNCRIVLGENSWKCCGFGPFF